MKREDFDKPAREDEYGTSVMGIQFAKTGVSTVSIKNRYNHTVNNPDATYGNNLDKIIPGVNNDETLLYGPEIKFFSNEIDTNNKFKLEKYNIYFVGDGAGKAGNIVTAAATGLVAARDIIEKK